MICILLILIIFLIIFCSSIAYYDFLLTGKLEENGGGPKTVVSDKKLDDYLTAKQEAEAKAATFEQKLKQFEAENAELKTKVCFNMFGEWCKVVD